MSVHNNPLFKSNTTVNPLYKPPESKDLNNKSSVGKREQVKEHVNDAIEKKEISFSKQEKENSPSITSEHRVSEETKTKSEEKSIKFLIFNKIKKIFSRIIEKIHVDKPSVEQPAPKTNRRPVRERGTIDPSLLLTNPSSRDLMADRENFLRLSTAAKQSHQGEFFEFTEKLMELVEIRDRKVFIAEFDATYENFLNNAHAGDPDYNTLNIETKEQAKEIDGKYYELKKKHEEPATQTLVELKEEAISYLDSVYKKIAEHQRTWENSKHTAERRLNNKTN